MINPFKTGDRKYYTKVVAEDETASFESGEVHPFYGTFALGRDAEWVCRLFVLEMKEEGEEGIGTYLNIEHLGPALVGEEVKLTGILDRVEGRNVHCSFEAHCKGKVIARGTTGQHILTEQKKKALYEKAGHGR